MVATKSVNCRGLNSSNALERRWLPPSMLEIRNQKSEILYLAHWPTIISAYKYSYNVNGPWAGRLPKDCNISRYHGSHPTERK